MLKLDPKSRFSAFYCLQSPLFEACWKSLKESMVERGRGVGKEYLQGRGGGERMWGEVGRLEERYVFLDVRALL
jgi:hypothetical protein